MDTPEARNNILALDRTVLANERTYQAWLRTGLSALVTGLGIARFLKDEMPVWMLLTIATIMISLSAVAFLQAAWRYNHLHVRMAHLDLDATPVWLVKAISVLLVGCSGLALVGIVLAALL
ncbi:MAG: DUF202 domain-containing protein [Alphaproteobacteria bacterium]|nr:DUF202 domain-containing protein [Alphaproteobacteria bacterium]